MLVGKQLNNIYMLDIDLIALNFECLITKNDDSWLSHKRIVKIHMHHLKANC